MAVACLPVVPRHASVCDTGCGMWRAGWRALCTKLETDFVVEAHADEEVSDEEVEPC